MSHSTQRFTSRVENYRKYRPHYPPQLLDIFREECGLTPDWLVADIGSGTGLSSELFLKHGNRVYGVEPNAAMRATAEAQFAGNPYFHSIDGTAEDTKLPEASVEMVVAGQALHWFHVARARDEFRRILKPGGWVAFFWTQGRQADTPFLLAYEQLLRDYVTDYADMHARQVNDEMLAAFFTSNAFATQAIPGESCFDSAAFLGGLLSMSYAPEPGHPNYAPMLQALDRIFAEHAPEGRICLPYATRVCYGQFA